MKVNKKIIVNIILTVLVLGFLWLDFTKKEHRDKSIRENFKLERDIELAKNYRRIVKLFEKKEKAEIEKKEKTVKDIIPIGFSNILAVIEGLSELAKSLNIAEIDFDIQKKIRISPGGSIAHANISQTNISVEGNSGGVLEAENLSKFASSAKANVTKALSLYKYLISVKFEGSYSQIAKFIIQATELKRLITVENINIEHSKKNYPKLSASLILSTYSYLP